MNAPTPRHQGPDPRSNTQKRLRALQNWRPSVSVYSEMRTFTFGSKMTQDLFLRVFARAQIAIYTVMSTLPVFVKPDEFREFEALLTDVLGEVGSELSAELARLTKIREENGIPDLAGEFTQPQNEAVVIYTAEAARFLRILVEFDRLVALANRIYFNGLWSKSQVDDCLHTWRRRIEGMGRELNALQVRARGAQRRVEKQHDDDRATRSKKQANGSATDSVAVPAAATSSAADTVVASDPAEGPALEGPIEITAIDVKRAARVRRTKTPASGAVASAAAG